MIRFVVCRGHGYTLEGLRKFPGCPRIEVLSYDRVLRSKTLKSATYVFTDLDRLSLWDLELAGVVYHRLRDSGVPALNDPAKLLARSGLLRALRRSEINAFDAYRWEEAERPRRYPVFLRRDAGHGQLLSGLLEDWSAVERSVEVALGRGIPGRNLLIVEYAAEPVTPGLFRKLAVARIGDQLVPQPCVHDKTWIVKYGQHGIATEELYQEELRLLRTLPFQQQLWTAFRTAHIDYGRADFGLLNGQPQIYEINTNPMVEQKVEHPSATRLESIRLCWLRYVDALRALDRHSPSGPDIRIADARLTRQQTWRAWFNRTRFAD